MQELKFEKSRALIESYSTLIAGGVNSNFRLGMAPGPLVFERGEGPYLFDADGNRLIDYYGGMGAMVLGHSPQVVRDAVKKQVDEGILFAGQSPLEYEAAEILSARIPSAERVRFGSSGSEVAQAAIRLSRAVTGRRTIIKFEGHYHGWFDNILWSAAPAAEDPTSVPVAGSRGQPALAEGELEVMGWNDLAALEGRLTEGDVAAVIMEPAMCNQGAIAPKQGYLQGVRAACEANGTLLIFDEVITGFRLSDGGAQKRYGVTPDLSIFAKAIANGFPVAALVGRGDLLDEFTKGVLHGGTFNAQPVAMAAMIATQQQLTAAHFDITSQKGLALQDGIRAAFKDAGLVAQVAGFPLVFHVAFGLSEPAVSYRDIVKSNRALYRTFALALLKRGVRVLERGAWFVSSVHTTEVVQQTIEAVRSAASEVVKAH